MPGWKDEARQRYKESKEGGSFKLTQGENYFRIMPAKSGSVVDKPYREFYTHYNVGPKLPGTNYSRSARCGKDLDGQGECWICDVKIPELAKSASPQKRALAVKMQAKMQLLLQVSSVDRQTGHFSAPKPLKMDKGGAKAGSTIFYALLMSTRFNYEDPNKGYNISLERTGTDRNTTYGIPNPDERPVAVPKSVLAQIKDLDELVPAYSRKFQENAYFGRDTGADDEGGEDVDSPPVDDADEYAEAPAGEEDYVDPGVQTEDGQEADYEEPLPEDEPLPDEYDQEPPAEEYEEEPPPDEEPENMDEPEPEPEPELAMVSRPRRVVQPAPPAPARRAAPAPAPQPRRVAPAPAPAPPRRVAPAPARRATPPPAKRPAPAPAKQPARPSAGKPPAKQPAKPAGRR